MCGNVGMDSYVRQAQGQMNSAPASNPVNEKPKAEEQAPKEEEKKLNAIDIAALSAAALAIVTAGVCAYRSHSANKALTSLQQTVQSTEAALQKAQSDLASTQNSLQITLAKLQTAQDGLNLAKADRDKLIHNLLFPAGIENLEFQQSNVGDCYFLSSIYGLSKNKKGQQLIDQMISVNDKGEFVVQFDNLAPIIVNPSELKGQCTNGTTKRSAYGDIGLQAIERAYGKYRKALQANRQLGYSMMAIDGGYPNDALRVLGGFSSNVFGEWHLGTLSAQGKSLDHIFDSIADHFEDRVVCAVAPPANFGKVQRTIDGELCGWMDNAGKFPCCHAYTITAIDKQHKMVTVVNPHDTVNKRYNISYSDFTNIFSALYETFT